MHMDVQTDTGGPALVLNQSSLAKHGQKLTLHLESFCTHKPVHPNTYMHPSVYKQDTVFPCEDQISHGLRLRRQGLCPLSIYPSSTHQGCAGTGIQRWVAYRLRSPQWGNHKETVLPIVTRVGAGPSMPSSAQSRTSTAVCLSHVLPP